MKTEQQCKSQICSNRHWNQRHDGFWLWWFWCETGSNSCSPVYPKGANLSGGHCISDLVELKRQLHNTVRAFQWPPQTFHSNITDTCRSPWSQWLWCLFILMLWRVAISKRNNLKHLLLLSNTQQQWSIFNSWDQIQTVLQSTSFFNAFSWTLMEKVWTTAKCDPFKCM